jgi:2-iminobutanoate/2-iminopropanoate deaminase
MEKLSRSVIEPENPMLNASRNLQLPHSPGIRVGDYLFLSGMVPLDPLTGERRAVSLADEIRTTLSNMSHMLQSAGSSMERVVRIQLVLADLQHGDEVERVYREFFPVNPPARTMVAMQLRGGGGCEIECVALSGVCEDQRKNVA